MQPPKLKDSSEIFSELESEETTQSPPSLQQIHRGLANSVRPVDELANFATHCLGFLLSLAGAGILMRLTIRHHDLWAILGCSIYSVSLVSLYAASSLSHAFFDVHRRLFYRKIDQMCIFGLIAGTYTPFGMVYLRHGLWPLLTVAMWVLALTGATIIWRRGFLSATAQKLYLLMGWLPAISLLSIYHVAPRTMIVWLVLGGVFYTLGTLFLWFDTRMRYFHATWHAFVIAGSVCHYMAILLLVSAPGH